MNLQSSGTRIQQHYEHCDILETFGKREHFICLLGNLFIFYVIDDFLCYFNVHLISDTLAVQSASL